MTGVSLNVVQGKRILLALVCPATVEVGEEV